MLATPPDLKQILYKDKTLVQKEKANSWSLGFLS